MGAIRLVVVTIPPLWCLRYVYFVQSAKDSKIQARNANINLESYVTECWNLKGRNQLDKLSFELGPAYQAISTVDVNASECDRREAVAAGDWCAYGICRLKQMPDDVLEQVVVLSTIFVRW